MTRKYHLLTNDKLRSQKFIIVKEEDLYQKCQLLRDIDFSVLANKNDSISLHLCDESNKLIVFDYVCDPSNQEQSFKNNNLQLTISFNYRRTSRTTYILCCPYFTLIKHPSSWSRKIHYGQCGQSCPCCRAGVGDSLGACPICK